MDTQPSLPLLFDGDGMFSSDAIFSSSQDLDLLLAGLAEDPAVPAPPSLFAQPISHEPTLGAGAQPPAAVTPAALCHTVTTDLLPAVQSSTAFAGPATTAHTISHDAADDYLGGEEEDDLHGDSCAEQTKPTKGRRRRVRTAKQQELNRLAQQRYRQRKKQKAADLSHQVDTLACQLEQLKAKDAELAEMKKLQAELTQRVLEQQLVIQQAHEQLVAKDRTIAHQAQQLAELKAQQQQQQQRLPVKEEEEVGNAGMDETMEDSPSVSASSTRTALVIPSLDPAVLSERLAGMLLETLVEVGVQLSVPAAMLQGALQQRLVQEMAACSTSLQCATTTSSRMAQRPGAGKARAPITVSCC